MFNKMFDMFDDLDSEKLLEVVNLIWNDREKIMGSVNMVWDNREKIMESVNLVWDNRDKLTGVLEFMRDNQDKIMDMIDNIPGLLGKTGDCIEAAGVSAVKASVMLTGDDDDDDSFSVRDLADLAATALDTCYDEITEAAKVIDSFGKEIDDITIPNVVPSYTEVMGFNVVSGLEFGEANLVDDAADRLKRGSDRLEDIGKEFRQVAGHMRLLGEKLTDAGGDLNDVGDQLRQSSVVLHDLSKIGT